MDERLVITRRIMKAMRHESARRPLTQHNDEGAFQLVICLPTDTVEYATQRVSAVGGAATVVVPHGAGLVPLGWVTHETNTGGQPENEQLIHPDSTMGMLVDYLAGRGLERLTFSLSPGLGDVDVTEGEQLTIPV